MTIYNKNFINGAWVNTNGQSKYNIINPATETLVGEIYFSNIADVNSAIAAAKKAFATWGTTSSKERTEIMLAIADEMLARREDFADAIHQTLGCPRQLTPILHVDGPTGAMRSYANRTSIMDEVEVVNNSRILKEPIGVCAFINPWNYPLHQLIGKVAPALSAGCTIVTKPAEQTPLQDIILAEVFAKAGLPAGVFNMILGKGSEIGATLTSHPDVDMVSFTGSTRAGIMVAESAAKTVKRVVQELGGKSPYIITADADLDKAVTYGVRDVMINSGQTCTALTRMLVPESVYDKAVAIAKQVAEQLTIGSDQEFMGPVVTDSQRKIILDYINKGIAEGATLVTGGIDRPAGISKGNFIKPTIFANVNNSMTIAKEEIFGPVLSIIPYKDITEAVSIANDTVYGLSSGVYAKDTDAAIMIAKQIRAGQCYIQGGDFNYNAPFGGYKQSGNGRELGAEAIKEYYEIKSIQLPNK